MYNLDDISDLFTQAVKLSFSYRSYQYLFASDPTSPQFDEEASASMLAGSVATTALLVGGYYLHKNYHKNNSSSEIDADSAQNKQSSLNDEQKSHKIPVQTLIINLLSYLNQNRNFSAADLKELGLSEKQLQDFLNLPGARTYKYQVFSQLTSHQKALVALGLPENGVYPTDDANFKKMSRAIGMPDTDSPKSVNNSKI